MNEKTCCAEDVLMVNHEGVKTKCPVGRAAELQFTVSRWGDTRSVAHGASAIERLNSQIEFLEQHVAAFWQTKDGRQVLQILNESLYGYSLVPELFDSNGRLIDYSTYWINLHLLHQSNPEAARAYDIAWQLLEILGNVLDVLFDLRCHRRELLARKLSAIESAA